MTSITPLITSSMLIAIGGGLSVAMLFLGMARILKPRNQGIRGRLAAIAQTSPYQQEVELLHDRRYSSIPFIDAFFRRRQSTASIKLRLERAGLPLRVGEYVALRLLAGMLGLLAGFALTPATGLPVWLGAAVGFGAATMLPSFYVRLRTSRRQAAIELQMVEFCDLMASMLESGFGYLQALTTTAEQIGPPLSDELAHVLDSVSLGGDVDEALEELNERLDSKDFDMMATAIAIQRRSGGNLAEILRGVAQTIRERHSFQRDINALTSRERYSAIFMVAFPFVLGLVLMLLLRETYGLLFTTQMGRILLGIAITMDFIGFIGIRRALKLDI